jgi:small subunit ribosomal protein S7
MRGKVAKIREVQPDEIYGSIVVTKFINYLMRDGKKALAQHIVYKAMESLAQETKLGPVESMIRALDNLKPKVELRTRRVGGANYQVPVPVAEKRQDSLAMRWIIAASEDNRGKNDAVQSLTRELLNAFNKEGAAYKKKEEVHKMAESNKAFSHLTW